MYDPPAVETNPAQTPQDMLSRASDLVSRDNRGVLEYGKGHQRIGCFLGSYMKPAKATQGPDVVGHGRHQRVRLQAVDADSSKKLRQVSRGSPAICCRLDPACSACCGRGNFAWPGLPREQIGSFYRRCFLISAINASHLPGPHLITHLCKALPTGCLDQCSICGSGLLQTLCKMGQAPLASRRAPISTIKLAPIEIWIRVLRLKLYRALAVRGCRYHDSLSQPVIGLRRHDLQQTCRDL